MQYVQVEQTDVGYSLDPTAYIEALPALASSLPPGARFFATDSHHYDFDSRRFIKNLRPQRMASDDADGSAYIELELRHNCRRHEEDLVIRYKGVRIVTIEPPQADADLSGLGEVLLDEILPHEDGCTHEIAFLCGSVFVSCADLEATWVHADCPERQPSS